MLWKPAATTEAAAVGTPQPTPIEGATALKVRIHQRLLELLDLSLLDKTPRESLRLEIRGAVSSLLADEKRILNLSQTDQLIEDVLDELLGLGPLEPLLKDESVSDILINTHSTVYVERFGRLEPTDVRFQDTRHLVRIINKIVAAVGRRVDDPSRWWTPASLTAAASTRSSRRWRSMGRWSRSVSSPRARSISTA